MIDMNKIDGTKAEKRKLQKLIDNIRNANENVSRSYFRLYEECRKLKDDPIRKRLLKMPFSELLRDDCGVSPKEYKLYEVGLEVIGLKRMQSIGWFVTRWLCYYLPKGGRKRDRIKIAVRLHDRVYTSVSSTKTGTGSISYTKARSIARTAAVDIGIDLPTVDRNGRANAEARLTIALKALRDIKATPTTNGRRMKTLAEVALSQIDTSRAAYAAAA